MRTPWIVGVSGASGTPYAAAVLRGLRDAGEPVDLVVSRAARLTILDETGPPVPRRALEGRPRRLARAATCGDLALLAGRRPRGRAEQRLLPGARAWWSCRRARRRAPASRSACRRTCCSGRPRSTSRSAGRSVVVPRETPVTRSHLEHLIALHDAGAVVLPASPGFYCAGARATRRATGRLRRRQGARRARRAAHPVPPLGRPARPTATAVATRRAQCGGAFGRAVPAPVRCRAGIARPVGARRPRHLVDDASPSSRARTSDSRNRRWPPGVRMLPIRPAAAQRVTVFGSTRNSAATSPGVSRRSPVSTAPSSRRRSLPVRPVCPRAVRERLHEGRTAIRAP